MIKRVYPLNDKILNFKFVQNEEDFIVEEQPIKFSLNGSFLILKIRKTNCDTWELIDRLAKFLGVYSNEIGYAGLKDKRATTTQYISIPKKYSKEIKLFRNKKIEILETFLHNEKLNIGDLEGNRFKINLHNVEIPDVNHIQKIIKIILKNGIPNYFGYQRFGKEVVENFEKAKAVVYGEEIVKDKKLSKMLISAYQSSFFNAWLVERLAISKEEFALLDGDIFLDLEKNKIFTPKAITQNILNDFKAQKITPTGLLPGRKVFKAMGEALKIESKYDDVYIQEKGYRREAIVYPKNITCKYDASKNICTLDFILPKGSYATVLVEYLANRNFS
ncbi:tRNA pseudouridine(13) synthase TruD [Arcobacter cloacae]|uniref:tRNA pseudouridine synthase D n=1 Tax=Arcobacter cloacae TaxID=1054034 RepID=A0A6M8NQF7_9BACT|nr:tRNA pseudouridine(13) synthase TruD [Arcobacter cloacae]NCB10051.1 tRNA pseudouridine(13) synthase TruD [Erysipelotrichia bacterium]QKF90882.1 tRNA pseudouridine 13 synthase [Arcobacter cloacae]RXI43115.1 pseudouridine synthase [Arcobacter cloacae]